MADSSFMKNHPQYIPPFCGIYAYPRSTYVEPSHSIIEIKTNSFEELVEATQVGAGSFIR
jgi:hypothetical protein